MTAPGSLRDLFPLTDSLDDEAGWLPTGCVGWTVRDLMLTLAVEATVHHLDLVAAWSAPGPSASSLALVRRTLDGTAGPPRPGRVGRRALRPDRHRPGAAHTRRARDAGHRRGTVPAVRLSGLAAAASPLG